MMNENRGNIIVVSAPSGAGKTTIVQKVLKEFPEIVFSVSATTRKKRKNEIEGVHYFFIDENEFKTKIEKNEFVEWERFYDYYYGTFKSFVEETINNGKNILLEVDVKGALSIKSIYPDSQLIYILPPSLEVLENRLKSRQTENEEDLKKRLERSKMELDMKDKFDHLVVNNNLDYAISETKNLINKIISKEKK